MKLVAELKENDEDFEFYPTTNEIINCVLEDSKQFLSEYNTTSILDIGAGNGKVLLAFKNLNKNHQLYAIEKSTILQKELVKFSIVLGADFHEQTLIDHKQDIVFCNPPYHEYEIWAEKIIKSCRSSATYLVIPQRWKECKRILDAIDFSCSEVTIIGSFDFLSSEDRKARAKIDVLRVTSQLRDDLLIDKFFDEQFGDMKREFNEAKEEAKYDINRKTDLITKNGLVGALVQLYNSEIEFLRDNYTKAAGLDKTLLIELGISYEGLVKSLRNKLESLKVRYWIELFNNLYSITSRLTVKNRQKVLAKIESCGYIDFNTKNIYAILMWVLESSNSYFEQQIVDVFNSMLNKSSVVKYKSNQRVFADNEWRYMSKPEKISHVSLDFRIILDHGGMQRDYWGERLSEYGASLISDILTVANILGFHCNSSDERLKEGNYSNSSYWESRKPQMFKTTDGEDLIEVKAFYNGNMHIRMSQKFALALNVAVGKLQGWLHNEREAASELENEDASKYFNNNVRLGNKVLGIAMEG